MPKHKFVVLAESILVLSLACAPLTLPAYAQSSTLSGLRQDVQRVIDRSNEQFQRGEESFQAGNYEQARRAYDKAVDLVLESGPAIKDIMTGDLEPAAALESGTIRVVDGNPALLDRFAQLFHIPAKSA